MTAGVLVIGYGNPLRGDGEPVAAVRLEPARDGGVMTHAADPRGLLALAQAVFGRSPEAWLVTAAGADFGFGDTLSPAGRVNARQARGRVERLVREATRA